ncbi:MAG TPA: ATP-grasp ribosomal peptide maturase [Streptomyces sp.]
MPVVLVVTKVDDVTADLVIEELNSRGTAVMRLDPGDFPTTVTVNAHLGGEGCSGSLRTATRSVELSRIQSVYWRRPSAYAAPGGLPGQEARWCADQARYGLGGLLGALPEAHYVNHPWRNRDAEYKPAQLVTAVRSGLLVPPTLLTNDTEQAHRFAREHGPVVYKPVRNTDFHGKESQALTVWVEEVEPASINSGVEQTTHLFQQLVDKASDIRLTAVGDHLFAVRIDGAPRLDWRRDYDALSYSLVEIPSEVSKGVRAYLDSFGLVFGAFDFGIDRDGRYWFYECNPNGQWAWFPEEITDQIAAAIADQLQHPGQTT